MAVLSFFRQLDLGKLRQRRFVYSAGYALSATGITGSHIRPL